VRLPAPFSLEGEHIAIDLPGARVLFTTRRGGVSAGPFQSLNLGRTVPAGDAEDDPELVARNREILAEHVGLEWKRFAYGRQVHGTKIVRVGGADDAGDADATPGAGAEADGQATAQCGVAALVLAADCLPVALASPGAVAMVHGGWRGLAGGIVAEAVTAMSEIGGREPLSAALGPGAGGCCYEVGDDVHEAFSDIPEAHRGRHLDLKRVARTQLERAGVEHVHDVQLCTICSDPGLFFSHRRDHGVTGRQGGVAWRT
jgi:YfiH family protein